MGRFAGDDVVAAVAIHVEGVHLRPPAFRKLHRMELPKFGFRIGRLFPPTIFLEEVLPTVTIHVADTHPVGKALIAALRCDWMELPLLGGIILRNFGVTELSTRCANELRYAV